MTVHDRKRQKKLERHKRKRAFAKRNFRERQEAWSAGVMAWVRSAQEAPFGPAWISADLGDADASEVVTIVVTRKLPRGSFLVETLLVDRTWLEVESTGVMDRLPEKAVAEWVTMLRAEGIELAPCDPLLAQSVVFHALDEAQSLGLSPYPDFEPLLLQPRPARLLEFRCARSGRSGEQESEDEDEDGIVEIRPDRTWTH